MGAPMQCSLVPGDLVALLSEVSPRPPLARPEMGLVYTVDRLYVGEYSGTPSIGLFLVEIRNPPGSPGWVAWNFRKVVRPDIGALRRLLVPQPEFV